MTLKTQACEALGTLFLTGFSGLELSQESSTWISESRIGGVILFAHNYDSPAQVAELTNQIQECRTEYPLWISVDQEGGRVQRFKKGFTRIPDAAAIGAIESPKLAFEVAEVIAKELKAVGINLNFCPVADILTNPKNPVIGNRSFGSTEDLVSKMVTAMVRGHLVNGVQPCVKHFPGHGDTQVDSHYALPRIDMLVNTIKEREWLPFTKAFKSKCSMVMTAHIINRSIDPQFPATLSRITLQDYLRKECRYSKVIVSDDMEMKAITDHFGAQEAPILALQAGCDQLTYRTETAAREAYTACVKAIGDGKLSPEIVLQARTRVIELKRTALPAYQPIVVAEVGSKIGTTEHLAVIEKIENPHEDFGDQGVRLKRDRGSR